MSYGDGTIVGAVGFDASYGVGVTGGYGSSCDVRFGGSVAVGTVQIYLDSVGHTGAGGKGGGSIKE